MKIRREHGKEIISLNKIKVWSWSVT